MSRFIKKDRGQSMVEMALVLPLLLLIMFGVIEGGRLFASFVELQNHARDGARYASIHSSEWTTALEMETWEDGDLTTRITNNLVLLDPDNLSIEVTKDSSVATDEWVEVRLIYTLELMTPIISDLIATDPANSTIDLQAKIAMRGE